MFLPHRRGFVEHGVERAVFFLVFLDKVQVLSVLIGDPCDPQSGEQCELQHAFAGNERLEGDYRAAEQVIVLRDYGFDVVAMRGEKPLVFARARRVGLPLGDQVLGIPDAVVHSSAIAIDERHFLGRIHLRNRAHTRAHKEA